MPPSAFTDVAIALSSNENASALQISSFHFLVTPPVRGQTYRYQSYFRIDQVGMQPIPSPSSTRLGPETLCSAPFAKAHNSAKVQDPFPVDSANKATWKYHVPLQEIWSYAVALGNGLSYYTLTHPYIDGINWQLAGVGVECINIGCDYLSKSVFTAYSLFDALSLVAVVAKKEMEDKFEVHLGPKITAIPAFVQAAPQIHSHRDNTAAVAMCQYLGETITKAFAQSESSSKFSTKRNKTATTKVWQQPLGAHEETADDGKKFCVPAELSKDFVALIEESGINLAVQAFCADICRTLKTLSSLSYPVGILAKFKEQACTSAFFRCFLHCTFHDQPMNFCTQNLDQHKTALNFLLIGFNNIFFREMVTSEYIKALEIFHK